MSFIKNKFLLLTLTTVTFFSCSKKSNDDTSTPSGSTTNVINEVYSALKSAAPDIGASSFISSNSQVSPFAAIGSNLSTANIFPDIDNPGSITSTGFDFLGGLLGSTSENSVFWRAKSPFLIACTIDTLATRGNNLYDTTQTSITFTQSIVGVCGTESDFTGGGGSLIGTSAAISVADLADTTYYDQVITMSGSSNPQFGGNDQWIYIRNNSTTLNMLHVEVATDDSQFGVNTLHFDKATESGFYQYVSSSTSGGQFAYRIYMSSADDIARVFTFWKQTGGSAHTIIAQIGSTFTNQTSAALSLSVTGLGSSTSFDNANACIDISTSSPSVSSDNTLVCGTQTLSAQVGAVSGHSIGTAVNALTAGGIRTWGSTASQGATKYPSFDNTTIMSASLGL